jgi:AraC family transcriptional regulator
LDVSKVSQLSARRPARPPGRHFHGAEFPLRRLDGATATRIVHPGAQSIAEHRHDWPVLSFYRMGAYRERGDAGEIALCGPSVIFHPAGAPHADEIGERGLETLVVEFDPAWLDGEPMARRSCYWSGGPVALAAPALARLWLSGATSAEVLRRRTGQFLRRAFAAATPPRPAWLARIDAAMEAAEPAVSDLARALDLHPAWLARTYRAARGEGLRHTLRRRRVEAAVGLIRSGPSGLAEIAAEAGFCDQSHMNRAFHAVLGRTPGEVRAEAV